VLGEFTESTAKGEWQASVQALTALRAKHGPRVIDPSAPAAGPESEKVIA
jgi:hypothetical protein